MKRANQKDMKATVASFKSIGLTQREFCFRENVNFPTFSYLYRKVCAETTPAPSGFTEVTASAQFSGLEAVGRAL